MRAPSKHALGVTIPVIVLAAVFLLAAPVSADDPPGAGANQAPDPAAVPDNMPAAIVGDEEAKAALDRFDDDYRARGLKGDEKLSQRDFAMETLSAVQHPDVVKALARIARGRDHTLRVLAILYLGEQRALPGLAGEEIVHALKRRGMKDPILAMSALDSLGRLRYLGAKDVVVDYLNHNDFAVKKAAIQAIGRIGDARLWKEIVKLAGVSVKQGEVDGDNNKEVVVDEGYSYDGVEVTYDTGASGDSDQKMAEKIGKEKLAANKAAAMGGHGGGGLGGGGGSATSGGVARDPKELLPAVLETLYYLTGERFGNSKELVEWLRNNREVLDEKIEVIEALAKAQEEDAKERD